MSSRAPVPAPLSVSASLAAVQGLVLAGLAVVETSSIDPERVVLGATTAVFFAGYAALMLVAAWALSRGDAWARGPVLATQLIQLGVAWNFRSEAPFLLLAMMVVAAVVAVLGVVHPASVDRLAQE